MSDSATSEQRSPRPRGAPPFVYDPEIAERFLDRLESGEAIATICGTDGIPSWLTIRKWQRTNEEFARQYARARELSAESFEHKALEIAETAVDGESAQAARIRIDTLKWAAGKRHPRVYGDKVDVNHTGTVTLEALITRSMEPVLKHVTPTIEHESDDN